MNQSKAVATLAQLHGIYVRTVETFDHCETGCTFCGGYDNQYGDRRLHRYSANGKPDPDLFCSQECRDLMQPIYMQMYEY